MWKNLNFQLQLIKFTVKWNLIMFISHTENNKTKKCLATSTSKLNQVKCSGLSGQLVQENLLLYNWFLDFMTLQQELFVWAVMMYASIVSQTFVKTYRWYYKRIRYSLEQFVRTSYGEIQMPQKKRWFKRPNMHKRMTSLWKCQMVMTLV